MIEQALYNRLSAELAPLHVYPVVAPQGVSVPYVVYSKISNRREHSHDGFSKLERPRFQVSVFAQTYAQAKQIAANVTAAIESWDSPSFQAGEVDQYESDTKLFHIALDFLIWSKEG